MLGGNFLHSNKPPSTTAACNNGGLASHTIQALGWETLAEKTSVHPHRGAIATLGIIGKNEDERRKLAFSSYGQN